MQAHIKKVSSDPIQVLDRAAGCEVSAALAGTSTLKHCLISICI